MDSVKTKTNRYQILNKKAITQVAVVAGVIGFKVYVAWEWPEMADKSFFAIVTLNACIKSFPTVEDIDYVANFGVDVTHTDEARKVFANLFV